MICRMAQARQAFAKYCKHLFQAPQVALEKKTALLLPLVLSILQYAMSTWNNFSQKTCLKVSSQLISLYKALLRTEFSRERILTMSHDEVLARVQLPSLEIMMHVARLRHFGLLMISGPGPLWALLEHEMNWMSLTQQSLNWMYAQIRSTIPFASPADDWASWENVILHQPGKWKGWLKRAQTHAVLQHLNQWSMRFWHCVILEKLQARGLRPDWLDRSKELPPASEHLCGPCRRRFANHAAWAVHSFKDHSRVNFLRYFVQGTVCTACAKEFWSTVRLHRHLKYQTSCAEYYRSHFEPGDPVPGLNSRAQLRTEPPLLAPPIDTAAAQEHPRRPCIENPEDKPHEQLLDDLISLIQEPLDSRDDFSSTGTMWSVISDIKMAMLSYPMPLSQIWCTWVSFAKDWRTVLPDEFSDEHAPIWKHVVEVVGWRFCAQWLVPLSDNGETSAAGTEAAFEWLMNDPPIVFEPWERDPPAAPAERFIVHLFSGRRRTSDLQESLEQVPSPPGVILHVISVDIIFGAKANLLEKKARQKWLGIFAAGLVVAYFAAPPCETWTEARYNPLPGCKIRPLRSAAEPWGLTSLSLRELRQIIVSNMLMILALLCFVIQQCFEAFGMVEHPALPKDPARPSIWATRLWKCLERECTTLLTIRQGLYGAASSKPTNLAFTPARPWIGQVLAEFRTTEVVPRELSIGLAADGSFKTAKLKEYPGALNKGLAAVFARWQHELPVRDSVPLPSDVLELLSQFEVAIDSEMGPDFVPPAARLINTAWVSPRAYALYKLEEKMCRQRNSLSLSVILVQRFWGLLMFDKSQELLYRGVPSGRTLTLLAASYECDTQVPAGTYEVGSGCHR